MSTFQAEKFATANLFTQSFDLFNETALPGWYPARDGCLRT
jgi:hypothetical protein